MMSSDSLIWSSLTLSLSRREKIFRGRSSSQALPKMYELRDGRERERGRESDLICEKDSGLKILRNDAVAARGTSIKLCKLLFKCPLLKVYGYLLDVFAR